MIIISRVDQLLFHYRRQCFTGGVTKEARTWRDKFKQWTTAYTMAAIMASGVIQLDEPTSQKTRTWLEERYAEIDALDDKEPGWKITAVALMSGAIKSFAEFETRLMAAAQRLFSGGRDAAFVASFTRSIDVELTKAWEEGADTFGVAPDEMTTRDLKVLEGILNNESKYILGIADDIQAAHDAGMEQDQFDRQFGARVHVWANRYRDVINQAMLYWGAKERQIWKLGPTENSCVTCPKLNGIVAFGEEWSKAGFHPQRPPNGKLECGGWACGCSLKPTKQRRTRNALKKLMAMR